MIIIIVIVTIIIMMIIIIIIIIIMIIMRKIMAITVNVTAITLTCYINQRKLLALNFR